MSSAWQSHRAINAEICLLGDQVAIGVVDVGAMAVHGAITVVEVQGLGKSLVRASSCFAVLHS